MRRQSLRLSNKFPGLNFWLVWSGLGLILALSWLVRTYYLWNQAFTYDEGHWLMFGLLANRGQAAYTETFVGIPPLALLVIRLGENLFGTSPAVRYPMMAFSLVGIGAVYYLFRPWRSLYHLIAGFLAATFLAFAPLYVRESASIMAESPAIAMTLVSLVLAQRYFFHKKPVWLVLSGAAFMLGLALKIFVVFFPILVLLLIARNTLTGGRQTLQEIARSLAINLSLWAAGALLVLAGFLLIYDPAAMYTQVLAFRFALRDLLPDQAVIPWSIRLRGGQLWPVYGGAIAGLLWAGLIDRRRFQEDIFIWFTWLTLGLILLSWHVPFRERYLLMLFPALAALNAIFVTGGVGWAIHLLEKRSSLVSRMAAAGLLAVCLGAAAATPLNRAFLPPPAQPSYIFDYFTTELADALAYVESSTLAGDCIITDDQRVALAVDRLTPPALSETSHARLRVNWLISVEEIIAEANRHDCPAVVYKAKRFQRHMPALAQALRELYYLEIIYDPEIIIYAVKRNVSRRPRLETGVDIDGAITLRGIDLAPGPWRPGRRVQLATYWSVSQPLDRAYKISLQLRNDRGQTVANFDHFPFPVPGYRYRFLPDQGGLYNIIPHAGDVAYSAADLAAYPQQGMVPTSLWPPGAVIREVTTLTLPETLSPGLYHLYIGMYDPETLIPLPVSTATRPAAEYRLISVQIIEAD